MALKRTHWRWLSILAAGFLLYLYSTPLSSESFSNDDYDWYFHRYSTRYLPAYDWRWSKAQGIQESLLNPRAVSHAGAMGIMQIMPGTWREETERLGIIASPYNPRVNILVGTNYMRRMLRIWRAPRTDLERLKLAQASYNAGAGNILRAQTACRDASLWRDISPCLPTITGRHAKETQTYVKRIEYWYAEEVSNF